MATQAATSGITPTSGTFAKLKADTILTDSNNALDVNFIAQSLFKTPVAINRTLITDNGVRGWVDSSLTIQQAIVPSGKTWSLCPSGGLLAGAHMFNIPFQVGAFNCDNNATAASTEPLAAISGNLTLTPAGSRGVMSVAEFNSLSHVPYSLAWDTTGATGGSEYFNWGGLFTNVADGKGGIGVLVKSNFISNGKPNYGSWSVNKGFQTGSTVKPSIPNGYYYQVTTPGALPTVGRTGSSEPRWCTANGCTVDDGSIVWTGHPQSGEGAWQIGYRSQDWLGAGLDIVNSIPYSSGNGIMLRAADNTYPLNIAFAHGNPNAGGIKWVVGVGASPNTDWFGFYDAGDRLSRLTMKPGSETRISSAGKSSVMFNVDAGSGSGGIAGGDGKGNQKWSVDGGGNAVFSGSLKAGGGPIIPSTSNLVQNVYNASGTPKSASHIVADAGSLSGGGLLQPRR